jgi:hypothetical protein
VKRSSLGTCAKIIPQDPVSTSPNLRGLSEVETRFTGSLLNCKPLTTFLYGFCCLVGQVLKYLCLFDRGEHVYLLQNFCYYGTHGFASVLLDYKLQLNLTQCHDIMVSNDFFICC